MPQHDLESFGAYCKARDLFDRVVEDMRQIDGVPACWKLIGQQVASADSICANIEEGYGRRTTRDYLLFLHYSRGSARETRGRYERLAHWLPKETVAARLSLCDEVISILTATITTLSTR